MLLHRLFLVSFVVQFVCYQTDLCFKKSIVFQCVLTFFFLFFFFCAFLLCFSFCTFSLFLLFPGEENERNSRGKNSLARDRQKKKANGKKASKKFLAYFGRYYFSLWPTFDTSVSNIVYFTLKIFLGRVLRQAEASSRFRWQGGALAFN